MLFRSVLLHVSDAAGSAGAMVMSAPVYFRAVRVIQVHGGPTLAPRAGRNTKPDPVQDAGGAARAT